MLGAACLVGIARARPSGPTWVQEEDAGLAHYLARWYLAQHSGERIRASCSNGGTARRRRQFGGKREADTLPSEFE